MNFILYILKCVAVGFDAYVGNHSGSTKEFFVGLAAMVSTFVLYFGILYLLDNKTKNSYKVNTLLSIVLTIFCLALVCLIAILVEKFMGI